MKWENCKMKEESHHYKANDFLCLLVGTNDHIIPFTPPTTHSQKKKKKGEKGARTVQTGTERVNSLGDTCVQS